MIRLFVQKIPLSMLIILTITAQLQHMIITSLAKLQPLSRLNLTLPVSTDHFEVTLLIGADYY